MGMVLAGSVTPTALAMASLFVMTPIWALAVLGVWLHCSVQSQGGSSYRWGRYARNNNKWLCMTLSISPGLLCLARLIPMLPDSSCPTRSSQLPKPHLPERKGRRGCMSLQQPKHQERCQRSIFYFFLVDLLATPYVPSQLGPTMLSNSLYNVAATPTVRPRTDELRLPRPVYSRPTAVGDSC